MNRKGLINLDVDVRKHIAIRSIVSVLIQECLVVINANARIAEIISSFINSLLSFSILFVIYFVIF